MISGLPSVPERQEMNDFAAENLAANQAPAPHTSPSNTSASQESLSLPSSSTEQPEISSILMDYASPTPAQAEAKEQPSQEADGDGRREYTDAEKDHAAHVITRTFREKIANDTTSKMLASGRRWKNEQSLEATNELPGENTFRSMKSLSGQNLSKLRQDLGPLSDEEKGFLSRGLSMNYYATHFTNNNIVQTSDQGQMVVALHSRDKLQRDGKIPFDPSHTPPKDIKDFGNSDHVFFSLEPGDEPKKAQSRFGDGKVRLSLNHPAIQQTGSMILNDMIQPQISEAAQNKYGVLLPSQEKIFKQHSKNVGETFVGKDIVPGLLLTAISDSRKLKSDRGRQNMMGAQTEGDFNSVLNGLYRPEVKVPRHFYQQIGSADVKPREEPPKSVSPETHSSGNANLSTLSNDSSPFLEHLDSPTSGSDADSLSSAASGASDGASMYAHNDSDSEYGNNDADSVHSASSGASMYALHDAASNVGSRREERVSGSSVRGNEHENLVVGQNANSSSSQDNFIFPENI